MNTQYLKAFYGLLGLLFVTGAVSAAQPGPSFPVIKFSEKPHAPVEVDYQFQSIPKAGQPLVIEMQYRTSGGAQLLDTSYDSELGLTISNRGDARMAAEDGGDSQLSQTITVIPAANGLYHLTVFANVWVHGQALRRVVSIPVQVGLKSSNPVVAEKPKLAADVNGVPIESMPATVSIKRN